MTDLRCERITRHVDETACDWCGRPVYTGENLYWSEAVGGAWCSKRCATADETSGRNRAERLSALLARLPKRENL